MNQQTLEEFLREWFEAPPIRGTAFDEEKPLVLYVDEQIDCGKLAADIVAFFKYGQ